MRSILIILLLSVCTPVVAVGIPGMGTWEITLKPRDVNNDGVVDAYYDTVLNITWLADAHYAYTSGVAPVPPYNDPPGSMTWFEALNWVGHLNTTGHLGANNWRLPSVTDTGPTGCDYAYTGTDCGYNIDTSISEMAHLHHDTLGNNAYYDTDGNVIYEGLSNDGPFINMRVDNGYFWSGTEALDSADHAWYFRFREGRQGYLDKARSYHLAWAIRDGDIAEYYPSIDIDPFSSTNEILPASDNPIVVAVETTNVADGDAINFDALQVDPGSLEFGQGKAPNIAIPWAVDVGNDGDTDVLFVFRTQAAGIFCDENEVILKGQTYAGEAFEAIDSITTTDCADTGCHPPAP